MAIKINLHPTTEDLAGKSHWWGFPDLPEAFVCQIRLEEIAELDHEGKLPHKGMLWFFADLDYFLGDMDAPCGGSGEWEPGTFKVLYSEDCSEADFGFKLLGMPTERPNDDFTNATFVLHSS